MSRLRTAEGGQLRFIADSSNSDQVLFYRDSRRRAEDYSRLGTGMGDGREHIFWLNGLAGTGKSTIAKTIAEWARKESILGGCFFFRTRRGGTEQPHHQEIGTRILHNIVLLDEIDEVVRDWNPASILHNIAEIELIEAEIDRVELIVDRQSVSINTIPQQARKQKRPIS